MKEIFLGFLEVSGTTAVIILAVALLSAVIDKKFSAKWKYWIWLLIAARLLIPFSPDMESAPAKIEVTLPDRVISAPAGTKTDYGNDLSTDYAANVPATNAGAQTEGALSTENSENKKEISLLDAVSVVWISGAAIFLGWNVAVYFSFRKRTLKQSVPAKAETAGIISKVKAELCISADIDAVICKNVTSPMVMGFIRPKLILPREDYGEEELYFILRHELTHYKRRDTLYKALLLLANAVHWFNPAVWLMQRLAGADLELSCDAQVVEGSDMDTRRRYSETILASVHREKTACGVFSTHFYGGAKTLKKRFANILSTEKRKKGITAFIAVLIVTAVLGSAVACSADSGLPSDEEVMELIAKAQSVYQPGDNEVLDTVSYENFIDGIYYDEIGNFNEAVVEIFSEKGVEQLKNTVEKVNGKPVFLEQEGRIYRYSPMADSDAVEYYSVVHSVSFVKRKENSFIYEIKHSSDGVLDDTEEYTSYITIVKENGNYLVENFDSKRFIVQEKEMAGENTEYSEPEIIADHIAAVNELSFRRFGARCDYESRPGTFLYLEYPSDSLATPDAVTFDRVYKGELSDGKYNGYYIDPFGRLAWEVENYSSKEEMLGYLREYLSEELVAEAQRRIDWQFFEVDGKLYIYSIVDTVITFGDCEIISQTETEMIVSAHTYNEAAQQEIGRGEIILEKQNGKWLVVSFCHISDNEEAFAWEIYSTDIAKDYLSKANERFIDYRDGTFVETENHHPPYPEDFPSLWNIERVTQENIIIGWRATVDAFSVIWEGTVDYIVFIDKTHAVILEPMVFVGDWGTSYGFGNTGYVDIREAGFGSIEEFIDETYDGFFASDTINPLLNGKVQSNAVPTGGTALTKQEIDRVSEAFNPYYLKDGASHAKIISTFLISYYANPEGMNPASFLYYFPSGLLITEESEFEDLKEVWASHGYTVPEGTTIEDYPLPLHKIPRSMVNEALEKYMGITIEELENFDLDYLAEGSVYYMEKYDCFYSTASDAHGSRFNCVSGEKFDDGMVVLYDDASNLLILQKQPDGSYFIKSYLKIELS